MSWFWLLGVAAAAFIGTAAERRLQRWLDERRWRNQSISQSIASADFVALTSEQVKADLNEAIAEKEES